MAKKNVCPVWVGYLLVNPIRRLVENPYKLFRTFIRQGMIVLEPGCGMGYFTIPLADMVGPTGKVIAMDIEPRMIAVLEKRASKAGMFERIERRLGEPERLPLEDLRESVDLAAVLHMLHETPDQGRFLGEIYHALKKGGKIFILEPKGHVSQKDFETSIAIAKAQGFSPDEELFDLKGRKVLLQKI
jgi:ubiquinone/menaquinone biosynthesis C-methylase UbiE